MSFLVLLGVLAGAAVFAAVSFATSPPPAPTISAYPPNPTSSQSASFTYTDAVPITKFQCKLDSGSFSDCGTTRPSTKSYSGLSAGSHTFQVRAVSSSGTSTPTSYTWLIDRTAPTVISINRAGASPTNAASVQWTVTFSEAVNGVNASDFALVKSGLGGTPAVTGVTPPVTTLSTSFTVTASTGSGSGTLGLNLVDNDSIVDAAGNKLGGTGSGNGNKTGQVYTIDRTPPDKPQIGFFPLPQPPFGWPSTSATIYFGNDDDDGSSDVVSYLCRLDGSAFAACTSPQSYSGLAQGLHTFGVKAVDAAGNVSAEATRTFLVDTVPPNQPTLTQTPPSSTSSQSATFAWTSTDPPPGSGIAGYLCKLDDGHWHFCSSPKTYNNLSFGSHTFKVVAIDWAGNISDAATYTWTISDEEVGVPFTIDGDADGLLYPGVARRLALTITNPNSVDIFVTELTVIVTNNPAGCPNIVNVAIEAADTPVAPTTNELQVPANATNWAVPQAFQPRIRLQETGANQDACQGTSFDLSYSGSAHS